MWFNLVAQTKQWVGELKMNGEVRGVAFTPDATQLLSFGSEAVYVYCVCDTVCHVHACTFVLLFTSLLHHVLHTFFNDCQCICPCE